MAGVTVQLDLGRIRRAFWISKPISQLTIRARAVIGTIDHAARRVITVPQAKPVAMMLGGGYANRHVKALFGLVTDSNRIEVAKSAQL